MYFLKLVFLFSLPCSGIVQSYGSSSYTVYGVLKARILKWCAVPFSSGPCFVRTLHHGLSLVALPGMAHSFIVRQGCGPS